MEHKRGDTFNQAAVIKVRGINGVQPVQAGRLAEFVPTCQIKTENGRTVIATLTCEWVNPITAQAVLMKATAEDTRTWKVGPSKLDIQLRRAVDDYVISTATLFFEIVEDVTQ